MWTDHGTPQLDSEVETLLLIVSLGALWVLGYTISSIMIDFSCITSTHTLIKLSQVDQMPAAARNPYGGFLPRCTLADLYKLHAEDSDSNANDRLFGRFSGFLLRVYRLPTINTDKQQEIDHTKLSKSCNCFSSEIIFQSVLQIPETSAEASQLLDLWLKVPHSRRFALPCRLSWRQWSRDV